MLLALALGVTGVLPSSCSQFDVVGSHLLPLAVALFLLDANLSELVTTGAPALAAFAAGALGTVLGTLVAWALVGSRMGPEGWKVAAALCASYIGGSINFAAVAQMVHLGSGPLMACTMAADNLAMAAYLAVISVIPVVANQDVAVNNLKKRARNHDPQRSPATTETLALSIAIASTTVALAYAASTCAGMSSIVLMLVALIASLFSTICGMVYKQGSPLLAGGKDLGATLMLLFFATIGAGAGDFNALVSNVWMLVFIGIQLTVHMMTVLAFGAAAKIPMEVILTASNANVGGPATAAAMAGARGWSHMVNPAMLTGSLGYAVGTGAGGAVGFYIRNSMPFGIL